MSEKEIMFFSVSSENERDHRTIEVLSESIDKKKQKVDGTCTEQLRISDSKEPTLEAGEILEHKQPVLRAHSFACN